MNNTWLIRNRRLEKLGFESYRDYLNSNHWINLRNNLRQLEKYKYCLKCNSSNDIQMHHCSYGILMKPNEARHIIPLCWECHNNFHRIYNNDPRKKIQKCTKEFIGVRKWEQIFKDRK